MGRYQTNIKGETWLSKTDLYLMKSFFQCSGCRGNKEGMHIASMRSVSVPVGINGFVQESVFRNISAVHDTAEQYRIGLCKKRNIVVKKR